MSQLPPKVLSFAASDPSGGAGIQADILTLASIGCHPLSVITAVTIQDTVGIENIMALDSEWIADQARIVLEDMPVDAFKIGLLGSVETVVVIAEIIADYPNIPVVLDPVLASGRGDPLANEQIITAIRDLLIPQTTIITPNSLEARRLVLENEDELEIIDLKQSADRLLQIGCEYALITGTHENTVKVINTLYDTNGVIRSDEWQRLPGSYHGSGCTLSSAIAASLAHGLPIAESVYEAQDYTWHALKSGFRPGMGQYLPDRFFWASDENDLEERK
ncbi:bifunctional hydroxymethylpyrimidine kinase/phosphomethylpyrimidine kinase [Nitrosomonas communis]|uniref:hydroxymethylpyrimidine kinase n=1 Tax=Nitrosomonas communis TaxID=44574 RepID=A0A1I4RTK6_9PROT|nr:hydroxymethylpyrimidine/phosphomethylpyrimidine kinase [Nitrosomonas communis]SFM55390.1 hydroxymethylpyrimidine/phosphomethylpyrimidine kinase [Nitrosomonas communis]